MECRLSVIVITRNRYQLLEKNLNSLAKQILKPFEVLIVDGSDSSYTPSLNLNQKLNIKIIEDKKKSIPYARNLGISLALGDIIVFLDDDCEVKPTFLKLMQKRFLDFPKAQAFIGRIVNIVPENIYASTQQWYYDRWIKSNYSTNKIQQVPHGTMIDFEVIGLKSRFIKKFKFDESLPFGRDEDIELGVRLFQKSKSIYFDPGLTVFHNPRTNIYDLIKRNIQNGYSNQYLLKKYHINTKMKPKLTTEKVLYQNATSVYKHNFVFFILLKIYPLFSKIGSTLFDIHGLFILAK